MIPGTGLALAGRALLFRHAHPHLSSGCERENRFCFLIFIVKGKRLKDAREMKSCENHF